MILFLLPTKTVGNKGFGEIGNLAR